MKKTDEKDGKSQGDLRVTPDMVQKWLQRDLETIQMLLSTVLTDPDLLAFIAQKLYEKGENARFRKEVQANQPSNDRA